MQVYTARRKSNRVDKKLAKLFLFFIPYSMFVPFSFLRRIFVGVAGRSAFLFFLLGLLVYLMENQKIRIEMDKGGLLFRHFVIMYLIVDLTSLFMGIYLYSDLGTIGGESTIEATIKKIIISIALIAILFYIREIFHILSKEEIESVFEKIILSCIALGLLQIGVLRAGGVFRAVYDLINQLFGAWTSTAIITTGRIALLTSEPAAIAGFFGVTLFPYLYSKWLYYGLTSRDTVRFFLLVLIMYHTKSTTGYALFCLDTFAFLLLYLKKPGISQGKKVGGIVFMIIIAFLFLFFIVGHESISSNIFLVFDKLLNTDNTFGLTRKIGVQINWSIFKLFPIAGVGNGNQGFYYQRFFPRSALTTPWTLARYNQASVELMDGGVFFASFLSGYGVVGMIFMVTFINKGIRLIKREKNRFGCFYFFYIMAIVSLIVYGLSSTLIGDFSTWFIFGLPMAASFWPPDVTDKEEVKFS